MFSFSLVLSPFFWAFAPVLFKGMHAWNICILYIIFRAWDGKKIVFASFFALSADTFLFELLARAHVLSFPALLFRDFPSILLHYATSYFASTHIYYVHTPPPIFSGEMGEAASLGRFLSFSAFFSPSLGSACSSLCSPVTFHSTSPPWSPSTPFDDDTHANYLQTAQWRHSL